MVEQKSRFSYLGGNGQWQDQPSLDEQPPQTLIEKLNSIYLPKKTPLSQENTDQQTQINTLLENLFKNTQENKE